MYGRVFNKMRVEIYYISLHTNPNCTFRSITVVPLYVQAIALGKKTHSENIQFNLDTITISCDEEVKLLGVNLDFMLNFNSHVSYICRKASKQLNVLKRIGRHLNRLGILLFIIHLSCQILNTVL